jgi:hypothetical protein
VFVTLQVHRWHERRHTGSAGQARSFPEGAADESNYLKLFFSKRFDLQDCASDF